ncbi:signal recognition particle 14 kDa protein isoform X1 [Ziziphus jujuba]|uniref:Signal recognition particle 14 kDa protein n=1 Tax=Ziziphus jujuba TaxID=326968 RepID=A0ABM3IEU8_ZIZJJ|nr:signal recognition particle 14 kDa protein isoform X1 [Ziziphus jujuba]
MVLLQPDPFLNELTSMFEHSTEKGSIWVTLKRSSLKSKVQRNKMKTAGEEIEYRCLIRATDGKKTISTSVLKLLIIIYVLRQLNNVDVDGLHNEWPFMARVLCRWYVGFVNFLFPNIPIVRR